MKKLKMLSFALLASSQLFGGRKAAEPIVTNIEPPYWWVGMASDTLQLMVEGADVANADFSVDYPGVKVLDAVRPDSPNYKFIYLQISPDASAGTMQLHFALNGRNQTYPYELRQRSKSGGDYIGFSAEDVLYLLMPDRFAAAEGAVSDKAYQSLNYPVRPDRSNPNSRHGGNLKGIEQHLDYLSDLGVTAIWVCPVLENDMRGGSYHGYATTDYYRIDPRFGSNDDWNTLIAEARKRGIKVVMDMIFNHAGSGHRWMKDAPFSDWFNHPEGGVNTNYRLSTIHDPYVSDFDLDRTVNGWFVPEMPDLNQRNPHLMKYLTQNSIWWVESSGINGIRMDTYPYADRRGMAQWAEAVMREYPNFNIVGECWYGNEAGSAFWQSGNRMNPEETHLPTVMDFKLSIDAHKMFGEQTDPWHGLNHLYDHLALDYLFPDPQHILTFFDNHDTDRLLLEEPEDLGWWKQAMTFLLTSRGIPQLYYGTELLMHGSKEGSDGYVRRDFPGGFPGDETVAFTPEGRTELQNEAWSFLSKLLRWRRDEANDVVAQGKLKHFMPQHGLYVYERKLGDRRFVVVLNGNDSEHTAEMDRTLEILPYGTVMPDLISGSTVTIEPEMTFAPRQIMILQDF